MAETQGETQEEKKEPQKETQTQIPQVETLKEEQPKKREDEILFPDLEMEGFIIRPWTLGKLRRINPHLEGIFRALTAKGINFTEEQVETHLMDIYFAAVPEIISILAISLDTNEEKLEDIPIPKAIKLIYVVYKQNEESIKNVLGLLQATR